MGIPFRTYILERCHEGVHMTPEQLEQWADMCTTNTETGSLNYLKFAKLIEAATREECAKVVEQEIKYGTANEYLNHNMVIAKIATKIRSEI